MLSIKFKDNTKIHSKVTCCPLETNLELKKQMKPWSNQLTNSFARIRDSKIY